MSRVRFSLSSKNHDGSLPITDSVYSLFGSFYGIREKNIKKIGMRQEEIDKCISLYLCHKKTTDGLSVFLRTIIKSKKISSDIMSPLSTVQDVVKYDSFIIETAINNLKLALENAIDLMKEPEEMSSPLKSREIDEEWERTCHAPVCYDRRCCLDKKAEKKRVCKTSLIRTGSRDYSLMLSAKDTDHIRKLIFLLEMGKKEISAKQTSNIV
jgi:hypothetical protein